MSILNIILAIVPGILICYLIFRFDRHEREKLLPLAICFILGVAVTFPAMQIESFADRKGIVESPDFWMTMFLSFIVVALTEELMKFICLMAYPYHRPFFNEPLDGIVYAVMIGMGFATLENILYAGRFGLDTMAVRAFTAVPAHGAFGAIAGYFVGRAKFDKANQIKLIAFGLLSAVGLHGLYDFFILQQHYEWLISFSTLTLAGSIYLSYRMIKEHQENSPFAKTKQETETIAEYSNSDGASNTIMLPPVLDDPTPQEIINSGNDENEIMDAILRDLTDEEE